jgi:import inner membrane translocase subunit TIM13
MADDSKMQIMRQVQQEAAMQNARMLVEVHTHFGYRHRLASNPASQKLNEHCFERCVVKPGTSLSSGEEGCFKNCMEKYMGAWNTVSKQYVARIQKESAAGGLSL